MKQNPFKIVLLFLIVFTYLFGTQIPKFVSVPGGSFKMGDHSGLGGNDPNHPSDEVPIHDVKLTAFYMGKYELSCTEYADFLNDYFKQDKIKVEKGVVYLKSGTDTLFKTIDAIKYSRIKFENNNFTIVNDKDNHPITSVRWFGAVVYCNWLSEQLKLEPCYDLKDWSVDFNKKGVRLPSEAEWEYAGRGGNLDPYTIFPWGDDKNESGTLGNWEQSGDPFESGEMPFTTPVGFYNGKEHKKSDFNWAGSADKYKTSDGSNKYGLHDMCGNVWEWTGDWYRKEYYGT
jgi:formylglycine-generating enzyme required for sulfatase activity